MKRRLAADSSPLLNQNRRRRRLCQLCSIHSGIVDGSEIQEVGFDTGSMGFGLRHLLVGHPMPVPVNVL